MEKFSITERKILGRLDTSSKQNLLADLDFIQRHTQSIDTLALTIPLIAKLKETSDKDFAKLYFPKPNPFVWVACEV